MSTKNRQATIKENFDTSLGTHEPRRLSGVHRRTAET